MPTGRFCLNFSQQNMNDLIHNLADYGNKMQDNQLEMTERIKINRLKVVLAEKELSQKQLAEMVGKAPNTITRICNNDSQPTLKFLREIALALNVDIRELLIPTKED